MPFANNPLVNYLRKLSLAYIGSELIPVQMRTKLLNILGAKLDPTATIWPDCHIRSTDISMGEESFINEGFFFDGTASFSVGKNVRAGQFLRIITGTHDIGPSSHRCIIEAVHGNVVIEDGCWIGANVTILPGVTVGQGCVVGANSLLNTSTEPNGLYVGTPARRIRDLPLTAVPPQTGRNGEKIPAPFPPLQRTGATSLKSVGTEKTASD